eukprot:759327-Hanusia_phi.AAC.10
MKRQQQDSECQRQKKLCPQTFCLPLSLFRPERSQWCQVPPLAGVHLALSCSNLCARAPWRDNRLHRTIR